MEKIRFAVDLGTTTIDTCLIDGTDGQRLAEKSFRNRQALYGSDVINRIMTVSRDKSYLAVLKNMVCEDLQEALHEMLISCGASAEAVDMICICGNTTMVSILLGHDIEPLGRFPFETSLSGNVTEEADTFFNIEGLSCPVLLSGCASAFIGGDILAGIVYLNLNRDKTYGFGVGNDTKLLLDLGTNGEMVLYSKGRYYAASTACGPAFEGCMRRQNVMGSSVIDAISFAVRANRIGRDGVIKEPYFEKGLDIQGIHIDMDILHQIMLAKAAICAGITCLAEAAAISLSEIKTVYLAGGFGFYLNVENAVEIGLLPSCFLKSVTVVGNTSLGGAVCMLTEAGAAAEVDSLSDGVIQVLSLAALSSYQEHLVDNMNLARTTM